MQRLFQFIYKNRAFFTFLVLEVVCGWLIVHNSNYQGAAFYNSSNRITGNVMEATDYVQNYFNLRSVNELLAEENARLKNQLASFEGTAVDSMSMPLYEQMPGQYVYQKARIVNNTVARFSNYMTLNKGALHGLEPGMGIISPAGVVGKVKAVSDHFSTAYSLLNTGFYISARIKETNTYCTAKWDGRDPRTIDLLYVPRHIDIEEGYTVVTSGYNATFPEGIAIGIINKVEIGKDASFYHIEAALAEDFQSISYVYVIKNELRQEQDSLQINTMQIDE